MQKKYLIIFLLAVIIIFRFFVGVYSHDEFGGTNLFIKHRPTWKWSFYSPIGMSDIEIKDLSTEEQKEQLLFNEFITNKGLSN